MKPEAETNTASLTVIGVDIDKEVFHLAGLGVDGKIAVRKRISGWPSKMRLRSCHGASLAWKPA